MDAFEIRVQESNGISKEAIDYYVGTEKTNNRAEIEYLIEVFTDAKEYGSILEVKKIDFDVIERRIEEIRNEETADLFEYPYRGKILDKVPLLIKQARIMSQRYDVVCTNPPYMGRKGMNKSLQQYVKDNYKNTSGDMSTVFMEVCLKTCECKGYIGMINIPSWMFLSTFEKLRKKLIDHSTIINMLHLGRGVFGSDFGTTAFVLRNLRVSNYNAFYKRLFIQQGEVDNISQKEHWFFNGSNRYFFVQKNYKKIPGTPIAYWASKQVQDIFDKNLKIGDKFIPKFGMSVGEGEEYIRNWYEVDRNDIAYNVKSEEEYMSENLKWNVLDKGGAFRRWYGNREYIVKWKDNGYEIRNNKKSAVRSPQFFFKPHISWTLVTMGKFSARYFEEGFILDTASNCLYFQGDINYVVLGFLNSKCASHLINLINPTINCSCGVIGVLPYIDDRKTQKIISKYVVWNIDICRNDWDSLETSWGFNYHPFLAYTKINNNYNDFKMESAFNRWLDRTNEQFRQLKENEERLNKIFIDLYGLEDELTPEEDDKDITISKPDRERDIKSFISYAVGCMFGRYSLDEEGLIYAGGEFDPNRYKTFIPTMDNVLIIPDDDYFEDDIVNRFVNFVKITFGGKTLEENLDYIAETLGTKANETSRQTIRRYFLKDFYNDHVKTYKKRPIYWLFDSGKENGFKALIYMHRYDSSTVARVRTDYLHKLQKKYEAEVTRLEALIESEISAREKAAAMKKRDSINKQIAECLAYDQVIAHVANQKIEINLDDGVKVNYQEFQGVLVPQGEGKKPLKANLLAKI